MFTALLLLFLVFVYFLPTLNAVSRGHRNAAAIGLLNLFLGWTGLGYIAAVVWSATDYIKPARR